jgi:RNA polymerase sigma-70 factor (ECF subfamily)
VNTVDDDIYRKHRDDLIRYATALVGPDDAGDVVSSVVLRVLAKRSLGDLRDARPYLFRAVLNEARSTLRRRRPEWHRSIQLEGDEFDITQDVMRAVLELPARQRAATYLVYWEGLTIAEAAVLIGSTPGTVKRYLHLARSRLRGMLDEYR